MRDVDVWEHRFKTRLREALHQRLEGSYKSKAYKTYIHRCTQHYAPPPTTAQGLGEAMATSLFDRTYRPGFMRSLLGGPEIEEYKRKTAEIKQRVDAVMQTVLPYSRHFHYPSKETE